jgi:hypothetical protein
LYLFQQAGKVRVAFRLERFLQRVEVQDERVRADHLDGLAAVLQIVTIVELHCAEIGKEQNSRGHVAHTKGVGQFGVLDSGALAAEAHRDAVRLRGLRQTAIDFARPFRPARHRRDQQRRTKGLAEQGCCRVHGGQVNLWRRLVNEAILFQPGGQVRVYVFFETDADVVGLALFEHFDNTRRAPRNSFSAAVFYCAVLSLPLPHPLSRGA